MLSENHWRDHGVRVVSGSALDLNTPQTPGMTRAAAITHARTGASMLWAGTVTIHPNAKTGAHHHGDLDSVIYVVKGRARMRWGDHLEFVAEAGPGDFIYVPPFVPHQEINASRDEALSCVLLRSGQDPVGLTWTSLRLNPRNRWHGSTLFTRHLPLMPDMLTQLIAVKCAGVAVGFRPRSPAGY
jgi:uncharacterized RmlC-like cupin family protein